MLDWQSIDTVLLDMDGTLLDLHFDNQFWLHHLPRRYAERHGSSLSAIGDDLHQRFADQRGSLNWYCVDYWSRELELDVVALKSEISHLIRVLPHVPAFLERLQQGPREVWLVTNAHRKSLELKMAITGLDPWFDHIVSSHDLQAPKEDPGFWQQLRQTRAFDPARSLLIDDTASVLEAARDFGIAHLLAPRQPDSQLPARASNGFPDFLYFDEIMPPDEPLQP